MVPGLGRAGVSKEVEGEASALRLRTGSSERHSVGLGISGSPAQTHQRPRSYIP